MDRYLEKNFKGMYRIMAEYNQDTNDWCKDEKGELDQSFADFYIKCMKGIKIKHGYRNELACYVPSKGVGLNILRRIYQDKIGTDPKDLDNDELKQGLSTFCTFCDILDGEVYFGFKLADMDYIATLVKPSTAGANISPFANSNLPKSNYKIPQDDLDKRKALCKVKKGDMARLREISEVEKLYAKNLPKTYKQDMRSNCMKFQQYIHSIGQWENYLDFLQKNLDK